MTLRRERTVSLASSNTYCSAGNRTIRCYIESGSTGITVIIRLRSNCQLKRAFITTYVNNFLPLAVIEARITVGTTIVRCRWYHEPIASAISGHNRSVIGHIFYLTDSTEGGGGVQDQPARVGLRRAAISSSISSGRIF